jgi:hypothetical protein
MKWPRLVFGLTLVTCLTSQAAGDYCLAIRGNGDAEPAHWGAMARTVEQLGLPNVGAGGSSATVSFFILDAIASNPLIKNQPLEVQKARASLLLKSLLGYFNEIQNTKAWNDLKTVYGMFQEAKLHNSLLEIGKLINLGNTEAALSSLKTIIQLGIINEEPVANLKYALSKGLSALPRAKFYYNELMETLRVFGKFDALHDDNLFFRSGLVSFTGAAHAFGKVAAFYAGLGTSPEQVKAYKDFMTTCEVGSIGKSWVEIMKSNPTCQSLFATLFKSYINSQQPLPQLENQKIGGNITLYPTTSVLVGKAAAEFHEARKKYHDAMDPHFGKNFKISNPEEIRFGYWGNPDDLRRIQKNLNPADEKSRRFMPLGNATWQTVLSLSPAEPGLSNLKDFQIAGRSEILVSAGGWSDLHPVLVLKAAGCDNVVYLTRTNGESIFAQGVAKRLMSLDRSWNYLDPSNPETTKINDAGDSKDMTSLWSRLYNLGNPKSSVNVSISNASAVLCTNWNAFDAKKDLVGIVEDSYHSSFWINPNQNSAAISSLQPVLTEKKPGCQAP